MDDNMQQLMQRVRHLEIRTRALSDNVFAGEYHAAFKGRGMSFSEVREYEPGDDIRDIDWNVTARLDRTYVKVFEEERELTVMLLIDVSGSLDFGTQKQSQRDMLTEIAATLSCSAIRNNDKIGVLCFSDRPEKFIPPAKGRAHILRIIRELLTFTPQSRKTDIAGGLEYFMRVQRKRCIAFLLSDFLDKSTQTAAADRASLLLRRLDMVRRKHDLVAIQVYDERMATLPDVGLVKMEDAETGHQVFVDTSDSHVRRAHREHWEKLRATLDEMFRRCRTDHTAIATGTDFVKPLQLLLAGRGRRKP